MGTNFNFDDTDHQVIFDRINGGVGSESLQQVSLEWQKLSDSIGVAGKSYVESAISGTLTTREGAAAQAATSAIGAMLPWIDDVVLVATTAARRAQGQADYWVTAKNSVPPVPPSPQSTGFFGDPGEWFTEKVDWFPGVTSEEEKAQQRQQDAAEQARQAMRVYQSSSNSNIDQEPAFTAPQSLSGSIGALPLSGAHVGGSGAVPATAVGGGGAGAQQAHLLVAPQPAAEAPAATVSQLAPGGHTVSGGTGPGQWAGTPTPTQTGNPGLLPVGAGFGGRSAGGDPAGPAPVRGAAVGASFAGGVPGGGGAGGGRVGAGHAGFGPRPSTGFGPQPAVGTPHSPVDETSGTRGGASTPAAARGAGGAGYGAPLAGGAGQHSAQDREHRSKYLVHDDSHAIVGDLPPTPPPVIGGDY